MIVENFVKDLVSSYRAEILHIKDVCGDSDDILIADMIEGSTDIDSIVGLLVSQILEDESHCEGMVALQRKLADRKKRIEERALRFRTLLASVVTELPDRAYRHATAHVRAFDVDPRVEIIEESAIPTSFWKTPAPKLDEPAVRRHLLERAKLLAALDMIFDKTEREQQKQALDSRLPPVPGVRLGPSDISVRIRVS